MPHVTISFETDHPTATLHDWSSDLGLLDPAVHRRLGIVGEVQVDVRAAESSDSSPDLGEATDELLEECERAMALWQRTPRWRLLRRRRTQDAWLDTVASLQDNELKRIHHELERTRG